MLMPPFLIQSFTRFLPEHEFETAVVSPTFLVYAAARRALRRSASQIRTGACRTASESRASRSNKYSWGLDEYACKNLTIGVRIYRAYGALGSGFQLLASGNWAPVWHPADSDDPAYCSLGIFLSGTPNHWEWPWAGTDLHPFCKVPAATTFVPDTIRVVVRAKVEGPLWPVYPPVDVRARKHFSLFENPQFPIVAC